MVPNRFIELDRRFREILENGDPESAAFRSYGSSLLGVERGLSWEDLLSSEVVVILGEPGSGKTWEMVNRTRKLREQGISAFFVPLERLVDTSLELAMAPGDEADFQEWKETNEKGTFFLDSVDEAKVRKQKDFSVALDNFLRGIGPFRRYRVAVVISARVSEWRWHADRNELSQRLGELDDPNVTEQNGKNKSKPPKFRIVQLLPLDRQQIRKFAEGVGLKDPEPFIEALDLHHAWEFAGRPIDVSGLIAYWEEHGCLGSLTQLVQFDLDNKLKETSERIQNDPLTTQKAREGAECLAAAVVLCRRFNFFVPDTLPPEGIGDAIEPTACLPTDWTSPMSKALLARAVFDVASYGRIRFHHRRVADYLASSWLDERIRFGCPYKVIEDLLFAYRTGQWFIRPSLRSVVAWLAIGEEKWNRRIRERILSCAPDLFLSQGDPESLPADYKQALLESITSRYAGRERAYMEADPEALSRLGDPILAPYVKARVSDRTVSKDVRILLIELIRYGRLRDCLDTILEVFSSSEESDELKSYAVAAIRDVGDRQTLSRLAEMAMQLQSIEDDLCLLLCETLYPRAINPAGLAGLFKKIEEAPSASIGRAWYLKRHLEKELPDNHAADLLTELLQLVQQEPHVEPKDKHIPISSKFHWVGDLIPTVLVRLLNRARLEAKEIELAANCLRILGLLQRDNRFDRDLSAAVNKALERHPEVRQKYFWLSVEELRIRRPDKEPELASLFSYYEVIKEREEDVDWLIQDIRQRLSVADKILALKQAIQIWQRWGRKRKIRSQIGRAFCGQPDLKREFRKTTGISLTAGVKRYLYRHRIYGWDQIVRDIRRGTSQRYSNLRGKIWLQRNLEKLRRGEALHALSQLAREASGEHSHWGAMAWQPLIAKHGFRVARAAATGWKVFWRQFKPLLPHEKPNLNETDSRIIIGLSGINVALADGELDFSLLTAEEAYLACRYAVNELNGFAEWLPELAKHHPNAVLQVLTECISAEWQMPADRENVHGVISSIRYHGQGLSLIAGEVILEKLEAGDPLNYSVLDDSVGILLGLGEPFRRNLVKLAAQRTPLQPVQDRRFIRWMTVWLQLDADQAIDFLRHSLPHVADADELIVRLCSELSGRSTGRGPTVSDPDYMRPRILREMIPLVYHFVRVDEDIHRASTGAYTPTPRDHAQDFRNGLFERLAHLPGSEAEDTLRILAENPLFKTFHDWILNLIDRHAGMDADEAPWQPKDIRIFAQEHETNPRSEHDLFKIACKRFSDIKDEVERGDISARYDLHPDDPESRLRSWLARQLRERSRDRYTVPQEEEIDLEQRPDLRIEAPGMGPISIEIKWADNCSLTKLEEGLADQLVGKYLRAPNSNYGIYLLGYKKKRKSWEDATNQLSFSFDGLVKKLQAFANDLEENVDEIDGLQVLSIDFSRP